MKTITFLAISILSISYSLANAETDWKLEKDNDGIKVWTRKGQNSNLKEYKASTILQTTTDKLVSFFKNYKLFDKWMYKVDEGSVKLIKKNNDNDFFIRMTMSVPLIKSRESLTHFVINPPDDKGAVIINMDAAPDILPKNDNYVRIPKMKGYWRFMPLGNGKVEVVHQALSSAGGSIPDSLANLGIVDAPYSMLEKLKGIFR